MQKRKEGREEERWKRRNLKKIKKIKLFQIHNYFFNSYGKH